MFWPMTKALLIFSLFLGLTACWILLLARNLKTTQENSSVLREVLKNRDYLRSVNRRLDEMEIKNGTRR